MRRSETLNRGWLFIGPDKKEITVDVPHTWNAVDGQDGGNDYWRGSCVYHEGSKSCQRQQGCQVVMPPTKLLTIEMSLAIQTVHPPDHQYKYQQ